MHTLVHKTSDRQAHFLINMIIFKNRHDVLQLIPVMFIPVFIKKSLVIIFYSFTSIQKKGILSTTCLIRLNLLKYILRIYL